MSDEAQHPKVTSSPGDGHTHPARLAFLDGWRGLSILAVLIGHFIGNRVASFGPLGVEMFFVLSGRLMSQILFVERFPLVEFYRRRVSRIFPALFVFVCLCMILLHRDAYMGVWVKLATAALLFVYNFAAALGHRSPALDHIWSLCIEEHSYVFLACVALWARKWGGSVVPALLVTTALSMVDGVFCSIVLHQDGFTAYWRTDCHIASITTAASMHFIAQARRTNGRAAPPWLSLTSAVCGFFVLVSGAPNYVGYTVGTFFLALSIVTMDDAWPWMKSVLSLKVLTVIGILSYSLYLWQQPFYQYAVFQARFTHGVAVLFVGPAVVCGLLSFLLVERPARRLLNRINLAKWVQLLRNRLEPRRPPTAAG